MALLKGLSVINADPEYWYRLYSETVDQSGDPIPM